MRLSAISHIDLQVSVKDALDLIIHCDDLFIMLPIVSNV